MTAPDNTCPVEQVEILGEALFKLSDRLRHYNVLIHEDAARAYEAVVQAFTALARQHTLPPAAEAMERAARALFASDPPGGDRWDQYPHLHDAYRRRVCVVLAALPLTDAGDGKRFL